jgi:hypothetical protein
VSKCENMFLRKSRKKMLICNVFPKSGLISSTCTVEFLLSGAHRTGEVPQY